MEVCRRRLYSHRYVFIVYFVIDINILLDVHVKDKANARSLGALFIGELRYDDLDEIIARYTDPIVAFVNEMLNYRKFKRDAQSEVDILSMIVAGHPKLAQSLFDDYYIKW